MRPIKAARARCESPACCFLSDASILPSRIDDCKQSTKKTSIVCFVFFVVCMFVCLFCRSGICSDFTRSGASADSFISQSAMRVLYLLQSTSRKPSQAILLTFGTSIATVKVSCHNKIN